MITEKNSIIIHAIKVFHILQKLLILGLAYPPPPKCQKYSLKCHFLVTNLTFWLLN